MTNVTIYVSPPGDGTVIELKDGDFDESRMSIPASFNGVPEGLYQVHVRRGDASKTEDISVRGADFSHTVYL